MRPSADATSHRHACPARDRAGRHCRSPGRCPPPRPAHRRAPTPARPQPVPHLSLGRTSTFTVRGVAVKGTPAKYDQVQVRRFGSPSARNVLVLVPGTLAGAADFDIVGPYLAAHVPHLQVWAEMRREGALQTQTAVLEQALHGKTSIRHAFNYYLGWLANGGESSTTTNRSIRRSTPSSTSGASRPRWATCTRSSSARATAASAASSSVVTPSAGRRRRSTRPGTSAGGPATATSRASSGIDGDEPMSATQVAVGRRADHHRRAGESGPRHLEGEPHRPLRRPARVRPAVDHRSVRTGRSAGGRTQAQRALDHR